MQSGLNNYLASTTSVLPLAVFRIFFGIMVALGILRFWVMGWIETLYIKPVFFFTYYGFDWVKPFGIYTYVLFLVCGFSAFFVALGLFYRLSSWILFLSFTYIELIDKSTYLNHYYFVSLVSFLLCLLPAYKALSLDNFIFKKNAITTIPSWTLDSLKAMVSIVYFMAGIAKIGPDWLLQALPLKIWLPAKNDVPLIGWLFNFTWTPYLFSWVGCLYDLTIPFLLWNKRTVGYAFIAVLVFHLVTAILFPIGMFPYIMIVTATIFFPSNWHLTWLQKLAPNHAAVFQKNQVLWDISLKIKNLYIGFLALFLLVQCLLPFRFLLYPGELFWTEQGYRFSWRVMLMEKAGVADIVVLHDDGHRDFINNSVYLSPLQEKMMATQPDMLLQYAHFLKKNYTRQGFSEPKVFVDSYVVLNGRKGQPLVASTTNLGAMPYNLKPKTWILPRNE